MSGNWGVGAQNSRMTPARSETDSAHIFGWVTRVDEVAGSMEALWGIDRLPRLVAGDLAGRFYSQATKFNKALKFGTLADVEFEARRMIEAWNYLSKVAIDSGGIPLQPVIWEVQAKDDKGKPIVVKLVKTRAEARIISRHIQEEVSQGKSPGVQVWTMDEVSNLITGFPDLVKTKEVFPGAEVTNVRVKPPVDWVAGDDLPESMGGSSSMGDTPLSGD